MICFFFSDVHSDDDGDHRMPPEKLMALTMFQPLMDYVVSCDHILYQCIVDFLIPSVLRSIPATLTQAIRNFAKSLEGWMKTSMQSYPQSCVQAKVCYFHVLLCNCSPVCITESTFFSINLIVYC